MTKRRLAAMLYLRDFAGRGRDRYFLTEQNHTSEVRASDVARFRGQLISHDYSMVAPSLYSSARRLPEILIDIGEFRRATCAFAGDKDGSFLERIDEGTKKDGAPRFSDVFYCRTPFDADVYGRAGAFLLATWDTLRMQAESNSELQRYLEVEAPVATLLWRSAAKGIRIDVEKLQSHKTTAADDYYSALKSFCIDFNLPIEMPSEQCIKSVLTERGFDTSAGNLDYILQFLPMTDQFGARLHDLRKLFRSLSVLNQLPVSRKQAHPIVDISGTATSRIVMRAPALQNLAKRHRDIVIPSRGKFLAYVDYCQYEPGIMCALSRDNAMRELYDSGDLYVSTSRAIFHTDEKRKTAKQLFLSFSYGMSAKRLADAAAENGAKRSDATAFFRRFGIFEQWRAEVASRFERDGQVGTELGNYLRRHDSGDLSPKERRSCVSQVVQGTASLIFKKALLALKSELGVEPLVPMHDAVLFEYATRPEVDRVVEVMERVFSDHFHGAITARAEIGSFAMESAPPCPISTPSVRHIHAGS